MPIKTGAVEYETVVVGGAYLIKNLLHRLGVVAAIDHALKFQPDIEATYGQLAQAIIANRLSFQPAPLDEMADWATQHGIDQVLALQAEWLDDDRLGALLEGVGDQAVTLWTALRQNVARRVPLDLEGLPSDTTRLYFEGAYANQPAAPDASQPWLVEGYNTDGQRHTVHFVLSLITTGPVPLGYRPGDGNQTDDGVYVADLNALRRIRPGAGNALLIGDRKLCTAEHERTFCQQKQHFLAAHPWTETAQQGGRATEARWRAGELAWTPVASVSRNNATKSVERRPQFQVCEVGYALKDPKPATVYPRRWIFSHSSAKAEQDTPARTKAVQAGANAWQRIQGRLGKYDYTDRTTIAPRIERALHQAHAARYWEWTWRGTKAAQDWQRSGQTREELIATEARFDGIALFGTKVPATELAAGTAMLKYKEQVNVEQTIDFLKSPVQIRPRWLHKPKRLMGLTLLIMIAVLVAALLEPQVRRWIAKTGQLVKGLMPEKRDHRYPTARALLRAFSDYALVLVKRQGRRPKIHQPELRPIQKQIWKIIEPLRP